MMKKILSIALVLVLCLTMLVACGKDEPKTDNGDKNNDGGATTTTTAAGDSGNSDSGDAGISVEDAKTALVALYQKGSAQEAMEIKADKKVFAKYQGLTVEWTITVSEGAADSVKVEAIEGNEIEVNIVIPQSPAEVIVFTAKATIKDDKGNSAVAEFLYTVPAAPKTPDADSTLTIDQAIELGASKAHNTYTEGKYYVIGTITEISSTQYGNMKIKDDKGTTLTIYGSFGPDGNIKFSELSPQPKAGDKVKVYGIIGQYNDAPQLKNGWIMEINGKKPGKGATTTRPSSNVKEPAANSNVSVADAIAIGLSKEHNKYTKDKYYVTGTVTEVYNEEYGNMKIKDDKGNILTLYGTFSADGKNKFTELKVQPKAGDTVKVYGVIGQFNEVPQVKNGWIIEINGKKSEVDPAKTTTAKKQNVTPVDGPVVGKAYKFGMIQSNVSTETAYFLVGDMNGYYMATSTDVKQAIDVYLEETDGGYYMYTLNGSTKTYINMVVSGTHVNGAYESKASTVYKYDKDAKTIIGVVNGDDYWFGTRNDNTYTTVGPCKTSYNGFYCTFYEAD